MVEMKPYDPTHEGKFCYAGNDLFDRILCTDAKGPFPIKTLSKNGVVYDHYADGRCECSVKNLMCVIPRREARVIKLYGDGSWFSNIQPMLDKKDIATFREVMPDDISQEKAQAIIEVAREVVKSWHEYDKAVTYSKRIDDLRAALGDDA